MTISLSQRCAIVAFTLLCSLSVSAQFTFLKSSTSTSNPNGFVPVAEAFPFNFHQQDNKLTLTWDILPAYYLYEDRITVTPNGNTNIGTTSMPQSLPYKDEFFGDVGIYRDKLILHVPILKANNQSSVTVKYQGCAEAGFCYPPEIINVPLSAVTTLADLNNKQVQPTETPTETSTSLNTTNKVKLTTPEPVSSSSNQTKVSHLAENWWQPLLFFGLGIGLAFTPCVLPMYPILTGIVLGGGKRSHGQTFRLSMLYVQGMALTYTLLGLVVASAGLQFQAALQNPYILGGLSMLFLVLAASMFGLLQLQLPASLQTKLSQMSNQQQGGNNLGVFSMGAISGLICSPCTTAPLSGALLYVAQSGDLLTGAVTLYALALGMGTPLILAAMFGNKLLPKAGHWMDYVKQFFGFILIAAAIFLVERLLNPIASTVIWLSWLLMLSIWLWHISRKNQISKLSSLLGAIAILGISTTSLISYHTFWTPSQHTAVTVTFTQIRTIEELDNALLNAKNAGKPVMLDFYADWCTACKEFEKYTFHDPVVAAQLDHFVLLQANVTDANADDVALLKKLDVLGLPTIDFWDAQGERISSARLTGFVEATPFLQHLEQHQFIPLSSYR